MDRYEWKEGEFSREVDARDARVHGFHGAMAREILRLAERLRVAEELLGKAAPVLVVLRPLFEERAGAWARMEHTAPEQITLAARFSVQELRQALDAIAEGARAAVEG